MRSSLLGLALLAALASPAIAADPLEIIEAPEVDPARFGWSGAYVGASGGYGWLRDVDNSFVPPFADHGDDWVAGVHVGYLHEFGSGFVIGAELEYTYLDIRFERAPFIIYGHDMTAAKLRVGWAWDRFLLSAHLGGAWATTTLDLDGEGFVVGANLDYALTENISLGVQYTHADFNNVDATRIDANLDLLTARAAFRF